MSERAYVQPKAIVGVLQYHNPNEETLIANKTLVPTDSSIQKLDPGNSIYRVIMPDPLFCEGMMFWIINSSGGAGLLELHNNTQTNMIVSLRPKEIIQSVCISGIWGAFNPHVDDTGPNALYYTKAEVNNLLANIRYA